MTITFNFVNLIVSAEYIFDKKEDASSQFRGYKRAIISQPYAKVGAER